MQAAGSGLNIAEVKSTRPLARTALYFASMVAFLVFANWGKPPEGDRGIYALIYGYKWWISIFCLAPWLRRRDTRFR